MKIEKFVSVNVNKNLGKKIIKNILPTKVCMFYELSETILLLVCVICILTCFNSCIGIHPMLYYTLKQVVEL